MAAFGRTRERLAGILNSAFAEGLLSEQTHAYRVGELFSPSLIDPQRLIGDLNLRRRRSRPMAAALEAWRGFAGAMRTVGVIGPVRVEPLVLALDAIERDPLLIGRHPACDVVISDPTVSRRHARLARRGGTWLLQDLASTNGTSVNGKRVGRVMLNAGDLISLGNQAIRVD